MKHLTFSTLVQIFCRNLAHFSAEKLYKEPEIQNYAHAVQQNKIHANFLQDYEKSHSSFCRFLQNSTE